MQNNGYRIIKKGLQNRNPHKNMKANKRPKFTRIPFHHSKHPATPHPHKTHKIAHTPASHKKQPFSSPNLMSLCRTKETKRQEEKVPTKLANSQVVQIFLHLSTKDTREWSTSEGNFLTCRSVVLAWPCKTCQVKNLSVLRILILQTTKKTNALKGERSTKLRKKQITRESWQRVGTPNSHIPPPTPKGMALKQSKMRATTVTSILERKRQNSKEKEQELPDYSKK